MSKKDVARQIRPRRDRVVVGVELDNQVFVYRTIREEAEARGWRLVNLYLYHGGLPEGVVPHGVLTRARRMPATGSVFKRPSGSSLTAPARPDPPNAMHHSPRWVRAVCSAKESRR